MKDIITLIIAILSFAISFILFCFTIAFNCKKIKSQQKNEGAEEEKANSKLDNLTTISNTISTQLTLIMQKIEDHTLRLTKIEEIVNNAELSKIPVKLAELEASVKSAHHRIDEIKANK